MSRTTKIRVSSAIILLSLLFGSIFYFYKTQPKREEVEVKQVLTEAASKRFKITKAKVLDVVEEKDKAEVQDALGREMLIEKLMAEVLDHKPELVEKAKVQVLEMQPKIVTLSQVIDGQPYTQSFIVGDTRKCEKEYEDGKTKKVDFESLKTKYCMDPNFDYPGGFSENQALDFASFDIEMKDQIEGVDNDFDSRVRVKLRGLVVNDFVKQYKATGKLTYVH